MKGMSSSRHQGRPLYRPPPIDKDAKSNRNESLGGKYPQEANNEKNECSNASVLEKSHTSRRSKSRSEDVKRSFGIEISCADDNYQNPQRPKKCERVQSTRLVRYSDSSNSPIEDLSGHPHSSLKHGGLIHLPKDVKLFNKPTPDNICDTRVSKPVQIVKPHPKQPTLDGRKLALKKSNTDFSQDLYRGQLEEPPSVKLNSLSQSVPLEAPKDSFMSLMADLSSKIKNQEVADSALAILQLSAPLTTLLVPPGECVMHIPPLADENSSEKLKMPEFELLFLRWWTTLRSLLHGILSRYEKVILGDLEFCIAAQVDQSMWKCVFYGVLEFFRAWITNPFWTGLLRKPEATPEGQKASVDACSHLIGVIKRVALEDVIKIGDQRLSALLNQLQLEWRVPLDYLLAEGRPPPEAESRTQKMVYIIAQKIMIYLGDLARYAEDIEGGQDFGKSRKWYQKAQLLIPKNGRPYHQLALLAMLTHRYFDGMCFYMRSLAASSPFPSASQSLTALFHKVHQRGSEELKKKYQSASWPLRQFPRQGPLSTTQVAEMLAQGRASRVEIWVHPVNCTSTFVLGGRSLIVPQSMLKNSSIAYSDNRQRYRRPKATLSSSDELFNDDEEEEALADAEEYVNMPLIELMTHFGLHYMQAHGQLFTKIGMETFPEVVSLALQAFSGLLAQRPCPIKEDHLCHLLMVNMFNVDRAAAATMQSATNRIAATAVTQSKTKVESETLRSVHHDHAARFALDTFCIICRRAAKLFKESQGGSPLEGKTWLHPDLRVLLPALRLWTEWMVLHPEHWSPPPNHRDPTLHPVLDDWRLVAEMCTQASKWYARVKDEPKIDEVTPTTALVVDQHLHKLTLERGETVPNQGSVKYATLFEETLCAGFKPMLDLPLLMYRYVGDWSSEDVAQLKRIEKISMFGDYLCGVEPPVFSYDVDGCIYEPVIERDSGGQTRTKEHPSPGSTVALCEDNVAVGLLPEEEAQVEKMEEEEEEEEDDPDADPEIRALRRERAALRRRLAERERLAAWRARAVREATAGGPRGLEIEVRPVYILPDTNCYIDWLEGVARLAQPSSHFTVLVPIVVLNELDYLASKNRVTSDNAIENAFAEYLINSGSNGGGDGHGRGDLIQDRAKAAIAFLESEFNHRNPRLRALTAKGNMLDTIAYRHEANGGRKPGQVNDDVILTCCRQFCKDSLAKINAEDRTTSSDEAKNRPMRLIREVVLLTSDRNLRLKALSVNIPARPLRPFVQWSCLGPVALPLNDSPIFLLSDPTPSSVFGCPGDGGGSGRKKSRRRQQ